MLQSGDLLARLRCETADLHAAVEEASGLPHSVQTRDDYTALLTRLLRFHVSAEAALRYEDWRRRWTTLGIDLAAHRRSALLVHDLSAMGAPAPSQPEPALFDIPTFAAALGCLYVVEGSALGGRVLAPAIRHQLGEVPASFLDSSGRGHPSPWRDLQRALRRYGASESGHDDVIDGARATFMAFHTHVATRQEVTN